MAGRTCAWTGLILLLTTIPVSAGPTLFSFRKQEAAATSAVPLHLVALPHRESVRQILEKPTLSARSQPESFAGHAEVYRYFLDHPDRAVIAWRRLGAKCVSIHARGEQHFSWSDENGGEVVWQTVVRQPELRVWYAEGKVKPSPLAPLVPVKVVVVVRHGDVVGVPPSLQQQTEVYVHTDSKTAALLTKMMGPSAQRIAEQGLGQFQFFFSGLCEYLSRHPDRTTALLRDERSAD